MTNSIINNNGKKIMLHRTYTENSNLSPTQYLSATKFKVGINNGDSSITKNDLENPIPISNGTVSDDGTNTLIGSNGGDNSTDNIITYKIGAGVTDDTAQNLIANNSSSTKTWTISDLSISGTVIDGTKPSGLWIYINDTTTLAKIVSIDIKLGSDSSNYYSISKVNADLSVGWNWLNSNTTNTEDLPETGTVTGNIDTFIIEISTNAATDTFTTGDVIYDLLRQWTSTDTLKDFVTGYPSINYTNLEAKTRCYLSSVDANGFNINGIGTFNEDSSPLMSSEATFGPESKSDTDEIAFVMVDRIV